MSFKRGHLPSFFCIKNTHERRDAGNGYKCVIFSQDVAEDLKADKRVLVALFLVGIFLAIILLTAAMVAFLCSRSSRIAQSVHTDAEARRSPYGPSRRPMSYTSSNKSSRRSFVSKSSRNALYAPQDGGVMSLSPSQPVVIETEDVEGGVVKITITPPTPSKLKPDRGSGKSHSEPYAEERDLEGSSNSAVQNVQREEHVMSV